MEVESEEMLLNLASELGAQATRVVDGGWLVVGCWLLVGWFQEVSSFQMSHQCYG